jgi:hypothetical protein
MIFSELCRFVDENRDLLNPDIPIGVKDHFGELEDTVYDLQVVTKNGKAPFIALIGLSSMYPEPD